MWRHIAPPDYITSGFENPILLMALDGQVKDYLRSWLLTQFKDVGLNPQDLAEYVIQLLSSDTPQEQLESNISQELEELMGPTGKTVTSDLFKFLNSGNNQSQPAEQPAQPQPQPQAEMQPQPVEQVPTQLPTQLPGQAPTQQIGQVPGQVPGQAPQSNPNGFPNQLDSGPGAAPTSNTVFSTGFVSDKGVPTLDQPQEQTNAAPPLMQGSQQEFRQNFRSDRSQNSPGFKPKPQNNNGFLPGFGFQGFGNASKPHRQAQNSHQNSHQSAHPGGGPNAPAPPLPMFPMPDMPMPMGMPPLGMMMPMPVPMQQQRQFRPHSHQSKPKYSFHSSIHNEISIANRKLVIENIPQEKLSEEEVRQYFSKFGQIESVEISEPEQLAIVEFESHEQAVAAHKSPDPIFGNRFVKIYWKKAQKNDNDAPNIEDIRRIQAIKQQQFEEREAKRKQLTSRIKEVIAAQTNLLQEREAQLQSGGGTMEQHEAAQKLSEQLSDELMSLKQELSKISGGSTSVRPTRGGRRGRGRVSPYQRFNSRGGANASSRFTNVSLDRRPKSILLRGVPSSADEELRGRLVASNFTDYTRKDDSTVLVDFDDRKSAEAFYNTVPKIQDLHGVSREWVRNEDTME